MAAVTHNSLQYLTNADVLASGQIVYENRCAACHRSDGKGMPPFAQVLSDDEVASVVTYIRISWGNHGSPVTRRDANALRVAPLLD
jgi:mono/diheme cytochrome c family protein